MPAFSDHAQQRWSECCESLGQESEWYLSRRAGKSVRRRIRESFPGHAPLMAGRTYRGFLYMVSRSLVVFVEADKADRIVTVWRLPTAALPAAAA